MYIKIKGFMRSEAISEWKRWGFRLIKPLQQYLSVANEFTTFEFQPGKNFSMGEPIISERRTRNCY